jgi:hypothetical protein
MMETQKMPSLELQTQAFYEKAKRAQRDDGYRLVWNGFQLDVGYSARFEFRTLGVTLLDVLIVADVFVPPRLRNRGWFTLYCDFCSRLRGVLKVMTSGYPEQEVGLR